MDPIHESIRRYWKLSPSNSWIRQIGEAADSSLVLTLRDLVEETQRVTFRQALDEPLILGFDPFEKLLRDRACGSCLCKVLDRSRPAKTGTR